MRSTTPDAQRPVCARTVEVAGGGCDALLLLAEASLAASGWAVVERASEPVPQVIRWSGQRLPPRRRTVVLLSSQLAATWFAARWLLRGTVVGLVDAVDLALLAQGVTAISQGSAFVSPTVLDRLARLPPLDDRQVQLLGLLGVGLRGRPLRERAAVSESTLKRELARLRDALGARSIDGLRQVAQAEGFAPAAVPRGPHSGPRWSFP